VFCGTKTNQIVQSEMKSEDASVIVDGHDGQIWALFTSPKEAMFATGGYDKEYQLCREHCINDGDIFAFVFGRETSPTFRVLSTLSIGSLISAMASLGWLRTLMCCVL